MKIAMLYLNNPAFLRTAHDERGLGGSENGFIRTAEHLSRLGWDVSVFNRAEVPVTDLGDMRWANLAFFNTDVQYDVVYSLRHREPFQHRLDNAKLKVLFLADTESHGLGQDIQEGRIDLIMAVSHWQKEKISKEEGIPDDHWLVTSNGIDSKYGGVEPGKRVGGRCLFTATPERGLSNLLEIWPRIRERVPHATLQLYSSFVGWGMSEDENDDQLKDVYSKIESMKSLGVVNKKHGNAGEIRRAQQEADLYLYPSDFYETCNMSVLEAMYCGVIPVTTGRAAMLEKVIQGITGYVIPAYGASSKRYQDLFVEEVVSLLTFPESTKASMRSACIRYTSGLTYDALVSGWSGEWNRRILERS